MLVAMVLAAIAVVYIQRRKIDHARSAANNPNFNSSQIPASPEASGEDAEEKFVFDRKSNSIRLTSVQKAASDGEVLNPTADPLLNPTSEPMAVAEL